LKVLDEGFRDMHGRLCFSATIAVFAVFAVLTNAHAQSAFIGLAWPRDNAAITKAGYDYPGFYGYRESFYYEDGPFEIPGKVIGGLAGLFTGILNGGYNGSPYYSRPLYVSPYYGSPFNGAQAYNRSRYENSPYHGGTYYFGSFDGGRGYYDVRRYESDRGPDDSPRHYGGRQYDDDSYIAGGHKGPYYRDAYLGSRTYDADDDD
jgi:hypothetical protein